MFHPFGKDIFAHTGGNFVDAIASIPFQSLLGPQDYQPWFVAAVLLANGLCFRVLMRGLCGSSTGMWASTMLWMVSPFTLSKISAGRLNQALLAVWDLVGATPFLDPLSPTQERIEGREWAGPSWTAYESEIERLNAD